MNDTQHATGGSSGADSGQAPHGASHADAAHGSNAHGDHAHGSALGPIDWRSWAAGIVGIAAGLVVAACFYISANV